MMRLSTRHRAREATPLEITEWLLRQPPPVTRGLVMNMPASGTSVEHRLFQARMWREYATAIKYDCPTKLGGVGRRWCLEIGRLTYAECVRRARVNIYLARRLNRTRP
jgi:hypothetical protein